MIRSAVIFIILSVLIVGCSAKMDPDGYYQVASVDDPLMLPYKFTIRKKKVGQGTARNLILQQYVPVDIYGSGITGMYLICDNWRPADSLTAILFYADTEEKNTLSQINVNTTHVASHFPYDFNGDNVIEVAVTYTTRDTLWLDIIDPHQRRIYRRPLVVGRDRDGNGFWDGSGTFCGVHDFNDDGYVELLVNCDVGYDLYPRKLMCVDWFNNQIVWEYEIAGIINSEHTFVVPLAPGNKPSIVFGVGSKGNAAKAGDMDDQHSYLIVLDENGKLRWKKETGGVFSSCVPVLIDYGNDGATEVLTTCRYEAPRTTGEADVEHGGMFKIYDMYGSVLDFIDYGVGRIISSVRLLDFDSDGLKELFVSLSDASIIIYDQRLQPVRKAKFYTAAGVWDCRDFLGTGNNQLLVASRDNKLWLLDKGFKPLAQFGEGEDLHYPKSAVYKARESQEGFDLIVTGNGGQVNYFLSLVKSPWNTVFFRYPLLAFLAALLPMSLMVALIWFNWHRTRKQKRIISQQRDRLNTALEDLRAAQEKLIAIEEYNKTQDALRASENRYKTLVENLPQRIFLKDKDSTYVSCNQNYARDLRIKPDEIAGKTDYEFYPKELAEKYRADDKRIVESGKIEDIEERYIQNGQDLWVHTVKTPVKDEKGNIVGVLGIFWDITEHKQAEEALREREERFRQIAENVNEGFFLSDASDNSAIYVSPAYEQIWGQPAQMVYADAQSWLEVVHPDDRERVKAYVEKHERGKIAFSQEYRILWPDGTIRWVRDRVYPIKNESAEVYRIVGVTEDITERKRAEEALRESEERYRALFVGSAEGILVADIETKKFKYANPALCRMLGYTEAELKRMGVVDIHPQDALEHVISEFEAQARGEKTLSSDIPCLRKDGTTIYADVNTTKVLIDGKECIVGFFTDITERKRAEEKLKSFSLALSSSIDGIAMGNLDGRITYVNEVFTGMFGYSREELIGKEIAFLYAEDQMAKLKEAIKATIEGGWAGELVARRKDGGLFPIRVSASRVVDDEGIVTAVMASHQDITERRMAEEALRESEAHYQELFDSVQEGIGMVDENEIIRFCNPAYARMFGEDSVNDLIGKSLLDYIPEDQRDLILSQTRIRKSRRTSQYELDIVTAANHRKTILASVSPRFDRDNQYRGAFGAIIDITERKQAEEALRESEAKHRTLVNRLPAITYIAALDETSTTLYISPQVELLLGVTQEEYLRDPDIWLKQLHPDDRERVLHEVAQSHDTGEPFSSEYRLIHSNGTVRWFRDQAVIVCDIDEKPFHLQGVMLDITERKKAEEALRSERDFVRSLLDTANSLIVCLDGRARITVFNKECEKVTGYTREEVIGKSWPEIFLPEDHHHHRLKDFAEWVRQHPRDMYEGQLKTKSGQIRTILWSNSALFPSDSDELTAIAIGQDITERKEAERQLQVASQKRYNQVKEIAGGVSHEIFNALFPATSCLNKLSQRLDLNQADEIARNRKLIQVVENAVQRAVEMTELVTEYSKLESDRKVGEVSLQAILQEILLANESRIEELKVEVKLEVSGDFLLKCHRPHVYSLFNNLMVNALDSLAEVKQRSISISVCEKGGRLSVEFSDSGVGIPPENIDKIFDAFFSTKPRTGTGLGLAVSKKIVELYSGSIEVNSSLDKGTKFIILL